MEEILKYLGFKRKKVFTAEMAKNLAVYSIEDEDNLEKIVNSKLNEIITDIKYKASRGQTILTYMVKREELPVYERIAEILSSEPYGYKIMITEILEFNNEEKYIHISWL